MVGFVASHGDAFEFLEFAEEVFDEMAPFVNLGVDGDRFETIVALGNDDAGATLIQLGDDPVGIEGFIRDQRAEGDAVDQRGNADRVVALARQEMEADQITERVGEGEDFGGPATLGLAYGLALSPPFEPWPWRWTLTMVPSIMANSKSGSSDTASKILLKTSAVTQSRKRLKTVFHLPKAAGKSRQGLPVRAIHKTASKNSRLSPPLRPGSVGLPKQWGSIFAH